MRLQQRPVPVNKVQMKGLTQNCSVAKLMPRVWDDLRGEAEHTHVLPDVPAVEELGEGQVGA